MSEVNGVPDEAIDIAAQALWEQYAGFGAGAIADTWEEYARKGGKVGYWQEMAITMFTAAAPTLIAASQARALRSAANDPAMRLSGHSGVSVRKLHARANDLEKTTS